MVKVRNALITLAVAFAFAGAANLAQAGCGSCGADKAEKHEHKDEHAACVKCTHAKDCSAEDCKDEAHNAECTCVKKEEKKEETAG